VRTALVVALTVVAVTPHWPALAQTATPKASIMTAAEIAAALDKAGPAASTMTGTNAQVAPGVAVRRRAAGGEPQYAIIHNLSIEVYQIVDGSGTLTTGGTLDPAPPADADPDLVRSTRLVGGESHKVAKGDVIVLPPGTPHWFNQIDGTITYLEARIKVAPK
jgi:mannose-6-phosphate isomerase-like protein (cupin superfamily)